MHTVITDSFIAEDINLINISKVPIPNIFHQLKISNLIEEKIRSREYFYGIEISPGSKYTLNYNIFKIAPLFTSIVWIASNNLKFDRIDRAPALRLGERVKHSGPVLMHLSCHNLTRETLQSLLSPNIRNMMIIRGDIVDRDQPYRYADDLVKEIRNIRGEDICLAVGGYPEGHPESVSKDLDLQHLKEKVDSGANIIITQLSFSDTKIMEFIRDCRQIGITVPILPGIYIPRTYGNLKFMCDLTKVYPSDDIMAEYENRKNNGSEFKDYAIKQGVQLIRSLFNSDLGIFGVQFFTTNYFENIQRVIDQVF